MLALVEPVRFSQAHFHSMHNTNLRGKTVISLLGVRVAIILSKDYKKDIFSILADGVELLHKRLRLLYITFNFKAADKNYLYFLF